MTREYQAGVHPTRRTHDRGTAGFPDGAGLYRRTGEPIPRFPVGGVMFVGHNTDAQGKHASRRRGGMSPGEPPKGRMQTWVRFYAVLERAKFDRSEFFFTNIYVGLKDGSSARGDFPGARDRSFCSWCDRFLDEQIELMQPRAIVTLGGPAAKRFGLTSGRIEKGAREGVDFAATALMHPSSGHLYKRRMGSSELWIDHEARLLSQVSVLL